MSPRAAWRLETLGFKRVFDYAAGKMDWLAFGLPSEGSEAGLLRAGAHARKDVPRCKLDERTGEVRARVEAAGWDVCAVVNDQGVLLGMMREKSWDADPDSLVETAMREGPSTIRPSEDLDALAGRMSKNNVSALFVTSSDGCLLGLLRLDDAQRALAGLV